MFFAEDKVPENGAGSLPLFNLVENCAEAVRVKMILNDSWELQSGSITQGVSEKEFGNGKRVTVPPGPLRVQSGLFGTTRWVIAESSPAAGKIGPQGDLLRVYNRA